jgi:hypothetical protein
VWLWVPRFRGLAVALGVALHVGMVASVGSGVRLQLVIFAIEMWALYVLFLHPAAIATLQAWWGRRRRAVPSTRAGAMPRADVHASRRAARRAGRRS